MGLIMANFKIIMAMYVIVYFTSFLTLANYQRFYAFLDQFIIFIVVVAAFPSLSDYSNFALY